MQRLAFLGSCYLLAAMSLGAAPVLTLNPASGAITGLPGQSVGWGFDISNDSSSYLVVTSLSTSGFTFGFGSLTDIIAAANFYVVNPNSGLSVPFDLLTTQGTAAYAINPGPAPGSVDAGTLAITYDLLVNDPNVGGSDPGDQFGLSFNTVPASVTVSDVPEPGSLNTMLTAAVLFAGLSQLRRPGARRRCHLRESL